MGSNLGERERQLRAAVDAIGALPETRVIAVSSIYVSEPVGVASAQPDYCNAVAGIDTGLEARALLEGLQAIEQASGRVRQPGERNAARTLDLDILLFDDLVLDEPGLHVPHPRMHERAFVLVPLAEIAADVLIPGRGAVRDLLPGVAGQRIQKNGVRPQLPENGARPTFR